MNSKERTSCQLRLKISQNSSRKKSTGSGKKQREKHGFMTEKRTSLQRLGMTGRPPRPSKMRR